MKKLPQNMTMLYYTGQHITTCTINCLTFDRPFIFRPNVLNFMIRQQISRSCRQWVQAERDVQRDRRNRKEAFEKKVQETAVTHDRHQGTSVLFQCSVFQCRDIVFPSARLSIPAVLSKSEIRPFATMYHPRALLGHRQQCIWFTYIVFVMFNLECRSIC